jgi:hypothetical protein
MLHRCLSYILIGAILFQTGCTKRIPVDVYPIRQPSKRIKSDDKVTAILREETKIAGTTGIDSLNQKPVEWQTGEITGQLVSWSEEQLVIRVTDWASDTRALPQDATFTVPINQVDQVDMWPGFKPGPALTYVGILALILGFTILLVSVISTPQPGT